MKRKRTSNHSSSSSFPKHHSKLITERKGRIKPSLHPKHFQTVITKTPIDFPSSIPLEIRIEEYSQKSKSTNEQYLLDSICQPRLEGAVEQIFTKVQIMQTIGYRLFPQRNEITRRGNYENSNYVSVIDDRVRPAGLRRTNRGG